jgi:hypothetical protein
MILILTNQSAVPGSNHRTLGSHQQFELVASCQPLRILPLHFDSSPCPFQASLVPHVRSRSPSKILNNCNNVPIIRFLTHLDGMEVVIRMRHTQTLSRIHTDHVNNCNFYRLNWPESKWKVSQRSSRKHWKLHCRG